MALICDIPELPSPAAEAQRKDPKRVVPLTQQPAHQPLGPTSSGQGISQDAPLSTHQLSSLTLLSGGLFSLSETPRTHPHLDFNKSQTFVSSGFFFQCHHFWRVVNSTHFSLQS